MTLVIGIVCEDGVVLAADSASTDFEARTKQPVHKIKRLATNKILYGGSGDGGLLQKIDEALAGFQARDSLKRIRQELKVKIVPEQREAVQLHSPYPAMGFNRPPDAVLLFGIILNGRPWLLEIEKDGRDTIFGEEMGNFAAIGSGKPWAQAIFRPLLYAPRDIGLGKVFAYRLMNDAIDLASGEIAAPIHIWILPVNGEPVLVDDAEMERLKDIRGIWTKLEAEAVGKLLAPRPTPEKEPDIPKPEGTPLIAEGPAGGVVQ